MAKLRTDSWHFKVYETFYRVLPETTTEMSHWDYRSYERKRSMSERGIPENLCPYFWKVVVALILFPVYLPMAILHRTEFGKKNLDEFNSGFGNILASSVFYLLNFIVALLGVVIISTAMGLSEVPFSWSILIGGWFVGTLTLLIAFLALAPIVMGTVWFAGYIKEKKRKERLEVGEERGDSLIKEQIKGWYHNYCPHIDWIEPKTKGE